MSNLVLPLLLGGIVGFLVNYLADVLPTTRRLSRPACSNCGTAFSTADFLQGKSCHSCGHKRFIRFWIVILAMAVGSAYLWINPPRAYSEIPLDRAVVFLLSLLLLIYFATVFVIDAEHRLILHPTSIVGAILGFSLGWLSHGLKDTLLGGLGGFCIMFIIYGLGWLFSRLRARRMQAAGQQPDDEEALGQGDVILAIVLGLLLGWPLIWFALLLGILLGGAYGIILVLIMLLRRRYQNNALMVFMPYGPFFILSAAFIIFFPHWLAIVVPK